jgi:hypothetical protein
MEASSTQLAHQMAADVLPSTHRLLSNSSTQMSSESSPLASPLASPLSQSPNLSRASTFFSLAATAADGAQDMGLPLVK